MEKSIGLGVFGTFGNPNGYQQSFFLSAHFPQNLDLNPNAIELVPGSELYVVRKDYNKGVYSFCFCIYTFARESQSNRRGTFIGNCVVFTDCCAEGGYIYDCLKEIHSDTINNPKNIANNTLQVQQVSDLEVKEPLTFSPLAANSKKIAYSPPLPDNSKPYFIESENLSGEDLDKAVKLFFNKAYSDFPQVGAMYFSANQQVIQYVKAKGLIQVADWNEFKNYTNQSPKQPQSQQEKKNPSKKTGNNEVIQQSAQGQAWDSFKSYETGFKTWKNPPSPWSLNETYLRVQEHNILIKQYEKLEDELSQLKVAIREDGLSEKIAFFLNKNKVILTVFCAVLLSLVLGYIFLFSNVNLKIPKKSKPITEKLFESPLLVDIKLNPEPNSLLKGKSINILSEKGLRGMTIEEVLTTIYRLNPSDVGKYYKGQEQLYAKMLMELNKDCFKPYNNHMVCFCDELPNIPIYR